MTDNYDVQNVSKEEMGALYNGDIRFTPSGLTYKNRSSGKVVHLNSDDIENVSQNFMANQPGLRIITKDGEMHRFANFSEGQLSKLKTYIATKWKRDVEIKENSLKGWNFGDVPIVGKNLQFQVNHTLDFEIPLSNVSNCTTNKSEAILEFHANDDSTVGLVEMRLHMPMTEGVSEEDSPAELLRQAIMKYAAVEAETEAHIVLLTNMLCLTPRGRYDIKIFPTFLSFHGKTYDYKIPARSVNRLFMLNHKDGRRLYFVMHINPPIRQGQTRYSFIVFEFNRDEMAELELSLTDEQLQDTYQGKIQRHLSGPLFQIVAKLFRVFVGIKVTVPGGFSLKDKSEAVTCSYKQSHGFLYPMDKGFMYVPKPPIYIRYEEIANVNFARSDVSTKTFDLEISVKGGTSYVFSSVAKDDFDALLQFCKEKNLHVQNAKNLAKAPKGGFGGLDDDVDPYKERLKSEAAAADSDEESDSDEEDEDFDVEMEERKKRQKGSDDSEATDGTEPDEEYDTGSDVEDDDTDGEKKKKRSSEKKEKRKEKSGASSSTKKKGGEKKRKDPDAPKRATSAYFHWMNEIRSSITKPGMGVAEVAKEAGRLWKEMSDADKKPYEEKSKEDKERYEREMKEYRASGGGASSSGKSKGTPKKASAAANTSKSSPTKGAKSREFLSSSSDDSSADSEEDEDAKKKKAKSSNNKKEEKKDKPSKKKAKTPSESEDKSSDVSDDSD